MFKAQELAVKPRILITEDEPEVRAVLCELLGEQYDCLAVGSAEEALAELRRGSFQLVISDIIMPGMSGLELVPHVLRLTLDTVVILISGMQTMESAIAALRAGAFDYVIKPFDLEHVEVVVRRGLEHQALRAAKRRYENYLEEMVQHRTQALDQALHSLENSYRTTLKALTSALETRDSETHGHSERVVSFSLRLGREMKLDEEQMRSLEFGSLLHDIGKIGVPDAVLRKPSALSTEDWDKMRLHPLHGQQILSGIDFLEGATRVVAQHHEKWDGSGYPFGLCGSQIDLNARIFAVADAFDAMTSDRVYRPGRSYELAATELDDFAGRQFDREVVAAFHRVPRADWDMMRRQSLLSSEEKRGTQDLETVALNALLESRLALFANAS